MTTPAQPDEFDRLGAAAARVLRAAFAGANDIRAVGNRTPDGGPEELLRELERAVAAVLREAADAADEISGRAARAEVSDLPGLTSHEVRIVRSTDERR